MMLEKSVEIIAWVNLVMMVEMQIFLLVALIYWISTIMKDKKNRDTVNVRPFPDCPVCSNNKFVEIQTGQPGGLFRCGKCNLDIDPKTQFNLDEDF